MRISLIFLIFVIFFGCYHNEEISPNVIIREQSSPKYEIQIKRHIKGRGNIHNLSFSKYEHYDSEWIYVNALKGKIEAQDIIFSHYWGCLASPWSQSKLKGFIEFKEKKLTISLLIPYYKDGVNVSSYQESDINGEYNVIIDLNKGYDDSDNGNSITAAPCDRTWIKNFFDKLRSRQYPSPEDN